MNQCCANSSVLIRKKRFGWINVQLAIVAWTSCCYQGDEAKPVAVLKTSPLILACHVILAKSLENSFLPPCTCKRWNSRKNSMKCQEWILFIQDNFLETHIMEESLSFKTLNCTVGTNDIVIHRDHTYSSYCCMLSSKEAEDIFIPPYAFNPVRCCRLYSHHHLNASLSFHYTYYNFYVNACWISAHPFTSGVRNKSSLHTSYSEPVKLNHSGSRKKRNSQYVPPFHIEPLDHLKELTVFQPYTIRFKLIDNEGALVRSLKRNVSLSVIDHSSHYRSSKLLDSVTSGIDAGQVVFSNVTFIQTGHNYQLYVGVKGKSDISPWTSEKLTVKERPLTLKSSGRTVPINLRENDTLSPAAGVVIYDVLDEAPAKRNFLAQYTWEGSIALFYNNIYPGKLLGITTQLVEDGSNEILFSDIIITQWGYSYILIIRVRALQSNQYNLTCLIGPFDVDVLDTFEQPLIDSFEFRRVRIVFDGDFQRVQEDEQKFEIFFLNYFGRKYPKVRWHNVTASEGSVIVDAVITGLTNDLDKTSHTLAEDISKGRADINYESHRPWKASRMFMPSRKLLEETSDDGKSQEGGLSVAWIVAIVINVVLLVVFIFAIVYCYCRRKRQREMNRAGSTLRRFQGGPDPLKFANKAENGKIPFESRPVFTVEDERRRTMEEHRSEFHPDDRMCTCYSSRCYCSMGDGRKTESRLNVEEDENEDDPAGYPTPSPEPNFPTPQPSPEPEDFWRPDSIQEKEQDEDMFLPGAVSDPEPDPPQEVRYYVYRLLHMDGSRELIGQIYLTEDSFLDHARKAIDRDRNLSEIIRRKEYRFLDDNLDEVPHYQESSLDLERVFHSREINIQLIQIPEEKPKSPELKKPRIPAYVGPLGLCNAADCTRAAKLKCLDCRNVAYCSKRCMREDAKDHRRACYKPAWRV